MVRANLLTFLSLFLIFFCSSASKNSNEEYYKKLLEGYKLEGKDEIPNSDFYDFVFKSVTRKQEGQQHNQFYIEVSKRIVQGANGKSVKIEDIPEMLSTDKIMEIMIKVTEDQYGKEHAEMVRKALEDKIKEEENEENTNESESQDEDHSEGEAQQGDHSEVEAKNEDHSEGEAQQGDHSEVEAKNEDHSEGESKFEL